MESLFKDIRYAIRGLFKRPAFTAIAVVTLALGIGANTAIFSLVNTVLLRQLPVSNPGQIVSVALRGKSDPILAFSYPNYKDFRDRNQVLSGLLIYRFVPVSFSRDGNNERVWGYEVSGNYFDMLGVQAFKGRTFLPEEDRTRLSHPVAVISYGAWQRRFGADPNIVGKEVLLNNHPFKIIGVAPEGFKGTEVVYTPELWVPVSMFEWIEPGSQWLDNRRAANLLAIGRLKNGVSMSQAETSLNLLAQQLAKEYPDTNEGQSITLTPPGFIIPNLRGSVVTFTWILMAAVGIVLLITCINLAGLLLARASDRRKEIAIRLAMGANRRRLIRQLLTENLLLSIIGGTIGFWFALWIINALLAFRPPIDFPLTVEIGVDWRVLLFTAGVSFVTAAMFGLVPALQSTRPALTSALKDTTAQAGHSRSRLRSTLVVAQLALSLMILIAAGLVARSLQQLRTMNPGFEPRNALTLSFDVGLQGYDQAKGQQFYRQVVERIESLPGVKSAALTSSLPLSLNYSSNNIYVEGQPQERFSNLPITMTASIGPRYFETMGTPILHGREFTDREKEDTEQVVIVNETFVHRIIPETKSIADALDHRVSFRGTKGPFARIVGVAKDGKYFNISEEPRSFIWGPLSQNYQSSASLVIRTDGNPEAAFATTRVAIQGLDPNLPLFDVKTFTEHMRFALFPARVAATVLGGFGLVALTLAAIGIYGVTSYAVSQRTREIGIRMALGAQLSDVLKMILSNGVKLTIIGVALGLAGAFLLTRALTSLLSGVSATDPATFIVVSIVMIAVALIASYVPARRATKVDPLKALRYE
ncbi:MAG TPA: ABC transporter permease [Pyrinomonadaceae bacterium]|nr:ABC transporter permease [Pyrinomonadaceae bacterium]